MDNNSFQNFVMQWLESMFNGAVNLIDKIINANGTYEAVNDGADGYKKVVVNVPQPTGTKNINITQNGTTTENVNNYKYAEITANVPNTYSAGDEGKVVSGGALVQQTARPAITTNGTYNTTLYNSVEVDVFTPTLESKSISANGTYTPAVGKAWNEVVVDVPSGMVLLAEITTTENVNAMRIDYTSIMNGYKVFVIRTIGTSVGSLYICPQLSTTSSMGYSGYADNTSFDVTYWVAPYNSSNVKTNTLEGYTIGMANAARTYSTVIPIEYFYLKSYYNTAFFAAGSKMQIWGYVE